MKAVVIHAYGGPEELKFEEYPDPVPGPGEVLVKVAATSVNPFERKVRSGALKTFFPLTFPAILGADVSGTVQCLGPGVQGFAVGDRVFGQSWQTYAQLCAVKTADLAKVPDGFDIIEIAALPTVTTTGAQLAELAIRGRQHGTVLVTGAAGGVGRSAVFAAKESGWTVITSVRNKQMQEAKSIGADRVIALDDDASLNSLELLDAIADTVSGPIADLLIGKVKNGGVFASVVSPPANASQYPNVSVEAMQVKHSPSTLLRMAEAVKSGKLVIPLGQRYPLSDASRAHSDAEKGGASKLLLIP